MQPVGQFDDDDAPVLRHRHEHGAQVLGLLVHLVGRPVTQAALVLDVCDASLHLTPHHLGQLAHLRLSLHDAADGGAEHGADLLEGHGRVLDDVM